jgi:hypothetical protein
MKKNRYTEEQIIGFRQPSEQQLSQEIGAGQGLVLLSGSD